MTLDELFEALDRDADGELSRVDLHASARRLRWHWPEAPIYAVLDLLTLTGPLSRAAFSSYMEQILDDPLGPYGDVLLATPMPSTMSEVGATIDRDRGEEKKHAPDLFVTLEQIAGTEVARGYERLIQRIGVPAPLATASSAALIIDPQRSFTRGTWMRSIGPGGDREVEPIRIAFSRCADLLRDRDPRLEAVFTRCPFPPDSYDWDDGIDDLLDPAQVYFIKPGNSALWPPTNGFELWATGLPERGRKTLVMGGCTLNSCVRVSAVETQRLVSKSGVQVVVALELCGARTENYFRSELFGGLSSVEAAVDEMLSAGVHVVPRISWR
jgi:nicotinamidase-related amidase